MALAELDVAHPIVLVPKGAFPVAIPEAVLAALYPPLFSAAHRLGAHEPEDAVQETLARLLARPPKVVTFPVVLTFALKVMKNLLIDQHRAEERRPLAVTFDDALDVGQAKYPDELERCQVCGSWDARCECCG